MASGTCWSADSFDDLTPGSLDGQNGWFTVPGRVAASVVASPSGNGQVIRLDPGPGETLIMGKIVATQADGMHEVSVMVLVQPGDTTMAKIEVRTTNNPNWDKKFQLYFGTHMRLNFGPAQSDAIIFLPRVEPMRWYHVRAVIDLASDRVDVYLDGNPVLQNIGVGVGAISDIGISAWDIPGFVLFDDLYGCKKISTGVAPAAATGAPVAFALLPNYPNPFNPETVVRFSLPQRARVWLAVYDVRGRRVATLLHGSRNAGTHSLRWNGRDASGRAAPSGVYLLEMQSGSFHAVRKIVLVR